MNNPRVAILLKSYLGDAVMAEPTVRAVRERATFVGLRASPLAREVLGHLPTDAFLSRSQGHTLRALREDVAAVRGWSAGIALVVDRSFRAALVARLARVPIRVGHPRDARNRLLTRTVAYDEAEYEAASYADLARAAGIDVRDPVPRLHPPVHPRDRGPDLPIGAVGLQPGARYEAKRIPEAASRAWIAAMGGQGRPVVLLGGPEERELCERIATPGCTLLAGTCSIPQTLAALARLDLFVSADTGLAHLAFGVRTPGLAVFGPTPAAKWTHGPPQTSLLAPDGDLARLDAGLLVSSSLSRLSSPSFSEGRRPAPPTR